jgi:hypothetical protein
MSKIESYYDLYHPVFPGVDENGLFLEKPDSRLAPKREDFDDIEDWQLAHDKWYRKYPGNCPNVRGHF